MNCSNELLPNQQSFYNFLHICIINKYGCEEFLKQTIRLGELSDEEFLAFMLFTLEQFQEGFKKRILDNWEQLVEAGIAFGNPFFETLGWRFSHAVNNEFKARFPNATMPEDKEIILN